MAAKKVLMLIGGKYHPFEACGQIAKEFLDSTGRYEVTVSTDRGLLAGGIEKFDALLLYTQGGDITPQQEATLTAYLDKGGAMVGVHCAADTFRNSRKFIALLGGEFEYHPHQHEFVVNIADDKHQVTNRLGEFAIWDEMYHLQNVNPDAHILATTSWMLTPKPMMYARPQGKGRVFFTALGHSEPQFRHPHFRKSLLHGLDWACRVEPKQGPIRCALLGYGGSFNMGRVHATAINAAAGLKAVAACDVDPERRKAAKAEFPDFATYASVEELLKAKDIDLVVNILPPNLHASETLKCLAAGKHVVLEKPFCLNVQEADAMIAAAKKNNVMLTVYHNRRWDGDYMTFRRLIAEDKIGDVFEIQCGFSEYFRPKAWWRNDKKMAGSLLFDWGAHFMDWVLGMVPHKVTSVTGVSHKKAWMHVSVEDQMQAIIRFENNTLVDYTMSQMSAAPRPRWRIVGTKGAIVDDGSIAPTMPDQWPSGGCKLITWENGGMVTSEIIYPKSRWPEYYINIADHLLVGDELVVKPQESRRGVAIMEAAGRSAESGKPETVAGE